MDLWLDLTKPLPELPVIPPPKRETSDFAPQLDCPPLNIVIFVVGSRGDVQPYMALALRLIERNGHRVRIATHTTFRDLVLGGNDLLKDKSDARGPLAGRLEFFDVGGDPKELMAYMVKSGLGVVDLTQTPDLCLALNRSSTGMCSLSAR